MADGSFKGLTAEDDAAWKQQQDTFKKKVTKKGLNWLARDASSAILVEDSKESRDASGNIIGGNDGVEVEVTDKSSGTTSKKKLLSHITSDGRKLFQNVDKLRDLSEPTKQKFISILANKGTLEALESDLAKDYQVESAEAGITVSQADAFEVARKQINDFGYKLLNRDVYTNLDIGEYQADAVKYVKEVEVGTSYGSSVRVSQVVGGVKNGKPELEKFIKDQFTDITNAKITLEPAMKTIVSATKFDDGGSLSSTEAIQVVESGIRSNLATVLSERFNPKDLGVAASMDQSEYDKVKAEIDRNIQMALDVASRAVPPKATLKDAKPTIVTSINTFLARKTFTYTDSTGSTVTRAFTPAEIDEIRNKILTGI
jgi:hypothetical protein